MRLLHEVTAEESLICRGEYRYRKSGKAAGQTEQWQITRLPGGGEVVRAEVTGKVNKRDTSLLTHLQRQPDGRPEWLRLRYESDELTSAAQYTFEEAVVKVIRQAEGHPRRQDVVDIATGYTVDYHPVIAHDYPWRGYPTHARGKAWAIPVFSPDLWAEGAEALIGRALRFNVKPLGLEDITTPLGDFEQVRAFEVTLDDGTQALAWFDQYGVPLRWSYPDKGYDFVLVEYER